MVTKKLKFNSFDKFSYSYKFKFKVTLDATTVKFVVYKADCAKINNKKR